MNDLDTNDVEIQTKYASLQCLFATFLSAFLITLTHFLRHLELPNTVLLHVLILIAFVLYTAAASLPLVLCIKRLTLKTRMVKVSLGINIVLAALGVFHIILEIVLLAS